MSPTCLLCFMVVLLGLVKLIPSVLHSHPVHETTSPYAALTAVSYQPDAIAPPSAVPGAGIPMAVPARDDGPELRPAASVPPAAELPPRKHAPKAAKAGGERCISFQTELCPPLNLSLQTQEQQSQTHRRCAPIVKAEQAHLPPGAGFCGRQLPRPNPCWEDGGRTFCLPRFYILGEMKCGTTTLYQLLAKHPRIALPRTKEPRYLMRGRHEDTSISRYAVEFEPAVPRPDTITFDASPVHLGSAIAPAWLRQFLPTARLIVLVRDPVQRAYSHWKMGHEWFESKEECGVEQVIAQGLPAGDLEPTEMEALRAAVRHETSFDGLIERSLMQVHLRTCKVRTNPGPPPRPPVQRQRPKRGANASLQGRGGARALGGRGAPASGFGRPPPPWPWLHFATGKSDTLNGPAQPDTQLFEEKEATSLACLRQIDAELTDRFVPEFRGSTPAPSIAAPLGVAMSRVSQCSEFMMVPGNPLVKGARYAENLESWLKEFPREQLLIIHTDDLTTATQAVMNTTFAHLGLPTVDVGTQSRFCVRGKAGVIGVLKESDLHLHLGENDAGEAPDPNKLQVGDCEPDPGNAPNVTRHRITPELEQRMRRYFRPFNEKLYAILGRDLGW
eukprot:Transcript_28276.p1 GENE.Transcript_28276~~Transcript_28276.p1  ORF type:complete len:701 (+),score=205.47 Transcript_28276:257-2104(+)